MREPGRRLRPPRGKLLHNSFVFANPFWWSSPVFGLQSAGLGAAGSRVSGWGGGTAPIWLGACARKLQVCSEPDERFKFTSKTPALGTGLERGPRLGCTQSPLTPGAKAAGHQDKADPAGGSGWGRPPELLRSSTRPKDRAVRGCFWMGLSRGFSNFHPRKGGCMGAGLLSAALGQGHPCLGLVGRV